MAEERQGLVRSLLTHICCHARLVEKRTVFVEVKWRQRIYEACWNFFGSILEVQIIKIWS